MKTLTPTPPRAAELFQGDTDDLTAGIIRLGPRDVRAFDGAATREVYCCGGGVWVTQEGFDGDVVLHAGEQFEPRPRGGKVVVQPLTPAATIAVTFKAR